MKAACKTLDCVWARNHRRVFSLLSPTHCFFCDACTAWWYLCWQWHINDTM